MSRPVVTLALLAFLTCGLGLGRQAITDSDEAYYAEASREMVENGNWLTPHFNYRFRWEKPVLYYWLTATTYLVTGPSEWSARLWSALSGIGMALLTWLSARHLRLDARGAWLSGAIVATCFGLFAEARLSLPDLPLAFLITLTIYAALRAVDGDARALRWWALVGAAAGLGFLMKGPIALVVPAIVLLPMWWVERRRAVVTVRGVALAGVVAAALGLPWYLAMFATHGRAYFDSFFLDDNLRRFATDKYQAEPRDPLFYIVILLGGFMPWTAFTATLLADAMWRFWRMMWRTQRGARPTRRDPNRVPSRRYWLLSLWSTLPLMLFTLSVGKQPRYILPVLTPFAILFGLALSRQITRWERGGRAVPLRAGAFLTAALFVILGGLLYRAQPVLLLAFPALTMTGVAALIACGLAIAWMAATESWQRAPALLAGSAAILLLTVQFGALSGQRPEAVERIAALVRTERYAATAIASHKTMVRNLIFYTGVRQVELFETPQTIAYLQLPDRVLLVTAADELPLLESALGHPLRRLGEARYLDPANIKLRTLLWPDPARDLDTVLLVSNK